LCCDSIHSVRVNQRAHTNGTHSDQPAGFAGAMEDVGADGLGALGAVAQDGLDVVEVGSELGGPCRDRSIMAAGSVQGQVNNGCVSC
jgi:hypothetical protein